MALVANWMKLADVFAQCWDVGGRAGKVEVEPTWCPGPDSNRHGVAPEGFSYHYSFRCCAAGRSLIAAPPRICGLDFTFTLPRAFSREV
jgi:hypothetical protein